MNANQQSKLEPGTRVITTQHIRRETSAGSPVEIKIDAEGIVTRDFPPLGICEILLDVNPLQPVVIVREALRQLHPLEELAKSLSE